MTATKITDRHLALKPAFTFANQRPGKYEIILRVRSANMDSSIEPNS
jgi:hypothetical protein